MKRPILSLIGGIAFAAFCAASGPVQAADDDQNCRKRLVAKGFPSRIETIAGLSAVRAWSETAKATHGASFGMWHNAESSMLKCTPVKESDGYYSCLAMGRPCLASTVKGPQEKKARAANH